MQLSPKFASFYQLIISKLNSAIDLAGFTLFMALVLLITFKLFWFLFTAFLWPVVGEPLLDWVISWESAGLRLFVGVPLILLALSPAFMLYYFLFATDDDLPPEQQRTPWWLKIVDLRDSELFKLVRSLFYLAGVYASVKVIWLYEGRQQEDWLKIIWDLLSKF